MKMEILKRSFTVIKGQMDGEYFEYYEDGIIKTFAYFKNDNLSNSLLEYYPSGALKAKTEIENDEKNGTTIIYNEIGKITDKVNYKNNQKHGIHIKYLSRKKKQIFHYENNKIHGKQSNGKDEYFFMRNHFIVQKSKQNLSDACCVCYELTKSVTKCNHYLCIECSKKTYSSENELNQNIVCPYCRTEMDEYGEKELEELLC